jgi:hypothetical protein
MKIFKDIRNEIVLKKVFWVPEKFSIHLYTRIRGYGRGG